jgi:hypothetical protein
MPSQIQAPNESGRRLRFPIRQHGPAARPGDLAYEYSNALLAANLSTVPHWNELGTSTSTSRTSRTHACMQSPCPAWMGWCVACCLPSCCHVASCPTAGRAPRAVHLSLFFSDSPTNRYAHSNYKTNSFDRKTTPASASNFIPKTTFVNFNTTSNEGPHPTSSSTSSSLTHFSFCALDCRTAGQHRRMHG